MNRKILYQKLIYDRELDSENLNKEHQLVLELVGEKKDVLEVGCHTGYFTKLLVDRECKVLGIEINRRAAEQAKDIADKVIVGDIEDDKVLNQINGKFDVILLMHVLEHLVNPWQVLAKIKQHLKSEGKVIIVVPNVACWSVRNSLFFKGKFEYVDMGILDRTHLRFFTFKTMRELIWQNCYKILNWHITWESVPLTRYLTSIPFLRRLFPYWRSFMLKRYPNLCGAIFVFEVKPNIGGANPCS